MSRPQPVPGFIGEPMRIGKHDWRIITVPNPHASGGYCIEYEWRRAERTIMGTTFPADPIWRLMRDWPGYDHNNGQTAGAPKTLIRLYERDREKVFGSVDA